MSLTAEALKKLGSEAAEGAAKEAKDWETVSASAYESLDCVDKRALSEVKMLPNPPAEVKELFSGVHMLQEALELLEAMRAAGVEPGTSSLTAAIGCGACAGECGRAFA